MNLTLDGLEKELKKRFSPTNTIGARNQVNYVRYCDDLIITGRTRELLESEVVPLVEKFLKERGLELSPTKTKITNISDGFDFLGKYIRKYKGKLLIKPSTKNVKAILSKIRQTVKSNLHTSAEDLILKLNPIIKGLVNYHRCIVSKKAFSKVDNVIFRCLWLWAKRRHPNKSRTWRKEKYFKSMGTRKWIFQATFINKDGELRPIYLAQAADVAIKRHIKIKS